MKRPARFRGTVALLAVVASTEPSEECPDPRYIGDFAVVLRSGPGPATISWKPACAVSSIVMDRQEAGGTWFQVWRVSVGEASPTLTPPVRFGQVFPQARQVPANPQLEAGATYRITLERVVEGDILVGQGSGVFIYRP